MRRSSTSTAARSASTPATSRPATRVPAGRCCVRSAPLLGARRLRLRPRSPRCARDACRRGAIAARCATRADGRAVERAPASAAARSSASRRRPIYRADAVLRRAPSLQAHPLTRGAPRDAESRGRARARPRPPARRRACRRGDDAVRVDVEPARAARRRVDRGRLRRDRDAAAVRRDPSTSRGRARMHCDHRRRSHWCMLSVARRCRWRSRCCCSRCCR